MTNLVVKWYFWGVERGAKRSPDMVRVKNQRLGIGIGEKKELRENILC